MWRPLSVYLTNQQTWHIIYLTRQPVREVKAPRPGDYKKLRSSRLFFTREQGGYFLCVYVRIATISNATDTINCNSSYVLISIPSPPRLRAGTAAALLAARLSILYCQCVGCPYLGHPQMLPLVTPESLRSGIPTLKYAVKYRIPFGRLVEPTSGICNTCPLFWGTGIELCPFLDSTG